MLQVGQTALVRVKASRADGSVPADGYATAEFWSPGKDPEHDPVARARPDKVLEAFFDARLRGWAVHVDTSGWAPGTWTVRGYAQCATPQGPEKGWSWGTLELAA